MKKILALAVAVGLALTLSSCADNRPSIENQAQYTLNCIASGGKYIGPNQTWDGTPECRFFYPNFPKDN